MARQDDGRGREERAGPGEVSRWRSRPKPPKIFVPSPELAEAAGRIGSTGLAAELDADAWLASAPAGDALAQKKEREREFLRLTELVRDDLVKLPLASAERFGAVDELVGLLVAGGELPQELAGDARSAVRECEEIQSTGWKYGLAFPHGRVMGLEKILASVGVSRPGVDFNCLDGLPARVVVLLLFPEACYVPFAPAIEDIAEALADPGVAEAIADARAPSEVVEVIEETESRYCA